MSLSYLPNVTTLQYDRDLCTGCGMCVEVCPHAVFRLEADHAVLDDRDACIECGACMTNCEAGALQVRAGVGCAAAILSSGGDAPSCGCA
jgi:NAD-dependent dihydropyrimidine dehydrogenase PreA subunit